MPAGKQHCKRKPQKLGFALTASCRRGAKKPTDVKEFVFALWRNPNYLLTYSYFRATVQKRLSDSCSMYSSTKTPTLGHEMDVFNKNKIMFTSTAKSLRIHDVLKHGQIQWCMHPAT
jgi:hypothetical protein